MRPPKANRILLTAVKVFVIDTRSVIKFHLSQCVILNVYRVRTARARVGCGTGLNIIRRFWPVCRSGRPKVGLNKELFCS